MIKVLLGSMKVICSFALLFIVLSKIDLAALQSHIVHSEKSYLFVALLLQHFSFLLSCFRSKLYLRCFGVQLATRYIIILYYCGAFCNAILPGGISGDVYKVYALWKQFHFPKLQAMKIFLYERLNGLAALCFLGCVIGMYTHFTYVIPFLDIVLWLGCIFGVPLYFISARVLGDKMQSVSWGLCYSLALQSVQLLSSLFIILSIENATVMAIIDYIMLFIIVSIAVVIPITIGGIGMREAVFVYGVQLLPNLDQTTAITIASCSFFIYLLAAFSGGIFLVIRLYNKNIFA